MSSDDPYRAPAADLKRTVVLDLASRPRRLAAFSIDASLTMVVMLAFVGGVTVRYRGVALFTAGALFLGGLALQLVLLHKGSWTVGKRAVGIRIVTVDGMRAGLLRTFVLRTAVPGIACFSTGCCFLSPLFFPIAGLAWLLFIVCDAVFIFGSQRRCVHDYIAGTCVVRARKSDPSSEGSGGLDAVGEPGSAADQSAA